MRFTLTAAALALGLASAAGEKARAQGLPASSPAELARQAELLKPGQWVWLPQIAPSGPLLIYVDLSRQLATVYRNGVRIGVSTISSGKPGHETPTGVFTILQKDAKHHSSRYNNAPMPFQQRLTWDGVALHAGGLPGYPESHGCVHLPMAFARALFEVTHLGATVVIAGGAGDHVRAAPGTLLAPVEAGGRAASAAPLRDQEFRWRPEASPRGPLTVIVSRRDQRIVVLRNGVEIGRSVALAPSAAAGLHVATYAPDADRRPHWIFLGVAGHKEEAGRPADEILLNKIQAPRAFQAALSEALRPGATFVITDAGVGAAAGTKLTVLDGALLGGAPPN
ncbi:L,D-transpeptidase [Phenylobacterium deserti]|uniref:L,D-transpeptidase n=1 Tax=Phenylobacterium deserti TaxID=1914756 RepID=A0A328ADG7_9CAUL|nr:L,D-transpeptidase [Phenylobacterium deserti]RAK52691.1 L,D-transpeptidase [Phenylobacterium deserti]